MLLLAVFISAGCRNEETLLEQPSALTRKEALNIVRDKTSGEQRKNFAIWSFADSIKKSTPVPVSGNASRSFQVDYTSWFFFIAAEYLIGPWPHACRYVFVDARNGNYKEFFSSDPPAQFSAMDTVFAWAKPQTQTLPPLTFSGQGSGCGNIRVQQINREYTAVLIVKADTAQLRLSTQMKQFDLSRQPDGLTVTIDFYHYLPENNDFIGNLYCNDVRFNHYPPRKWIAFAGTVQILISKPISPQGYTTTIRLEKARFVDEAGGNELTLDTAVFEKIFVGWLPG